MNDGICYGAKERNVTKMVFTKRWEGLPSPALAASSTLKCVGKVEDGCNTCRGVLKSPTTATWGE